MKFRFNILSSLIATLFCVEAYVPTTIKELELKAKQGDAFSLNQLATCYQLGSGVNKNEEKAIELYKQAADKGNIDALYKLGCIYKKDPNHQSDALNLLEKASNLGHDHAQYDLGRMYQEGDGVALDLSKAIELYTKSADQEYGVALITLAKLYRRGIGVTKNLPKAIELLTRAAKLGYPEGSAYPSSNWLLGCIYLHGDEGIPKDEAKAKELLQKAAKFGYEPIPLKNNS